MNRYVVAFFLFSFLGWVWESIYCTLRDKKWANRGFLYGPVCPIYGFGSLACFLMHDLTEKGYLPETSWWVVFLLGFATSMILEYFTSWLLEKLFNARWWDYSTLPLNLKGRSSMPTSVAFGVGAIVLMKGLIPALYLFLEKAPKPMLDAFSLLFVALLSIDTALTVSSLTNFQKQVTAIEEGFQNRMTNIVDKLFGYKENLYNKSVQRIRIFKFPGHRNRIARQLREQRFEELVREYFEHEIVLQMDKYIQHGNTTTLEHCENVAWISYLINQKLNLNADEKALVEAAILHDLFLYDWHEEDSERKLHGFHHAEIACNNAVKYFNISEKERHAIRSHMWPLNITRIPKNKEALIICIADKYCALVETIRLNKCLGLRK
ncbi:MAG: putative ABC transporter permease [Clostridia bacterium]|jgi:uncharacterized protein